MRQAGIKISLQIKRTFFSSNLLKFTSSDQLEGGGGAKPISQSFKDQVRL